MRRRQSKPCVRPSSRPIRDSSEGLARSTVRWMRSSVGRKNRSTGSPSLRERVERAVQRRTPCTLRHRPRRLARVPVRDCHPTRRHHARRTLHVLPDDDARRSWRRLRPATHEPHGGFLGDNFTPYPYDQEDGRVRNFSSNVEVTLDPTAKRGRRLVELRIDGEPVDPGGDVLGGDVPPTR